MLALQWIVATAITGFGALIAYFQWKTARQRAVLDLFDRRKAVYDKVRSQVLFISAHGASNQDTELELAEATEIARFFFGEEIVFYLLGIYDRTIQLNACNSRMEHIADEEELQKVAAKRGEAFDAIIAFVKEAPIVFAPYLRFDQKLPTPLRERLPFLRRSI
jgi:hypothetical protein